MTLTQLRYLVAIVEHGFNISKAAIAVHTSQPGVSKQMQMLESELGINILDRNLGRIVGLTEHGMLVAESAKAIVKEADKLKSMGDEVLQQDAGELRIAGLHAHAVSLFPKAVVSVQQAFPRVTVQVQLASAAHCFELLRAGELDFGITIEPPPEPHQLLAIPLGENPRVLIVPAKHPLLQRQPVTLEDIAAYDMLISRDTGVNWEVLRTFQRAGLKVRSIAYLTDAEVVKAFVREGAGISIVSSLSIDEQPDYSLGTINVNHIFGLGQSFLIFDPFRYMRGYGYHFIEKLAPEWPRKKVEREIRRCIYP
ncbi:MAG: LysR family transcriptional regulator [Burkholderiales bacterium]|nr:LysR family transcriptional regulator [Burkholderiales bacterium]